MALDCTVAGLRVRSAAGTEDLRKAQSLRHSCFVLARGHPPRTGGIESDRFDRLSDHMLIEETRTGTLMAAFRYRLIPADALSESYTGGLYDLSPLASLPGPYLEVGRFCTVPGPLDADVLRLAWAALARLATDTEATHLIGCSSFPGSDPTHHAEALRLLAARHVAPLRVGRRAPVTVDLPAPDPVPDPAPDPAKAPRTGLAGLPPLLRTYLSLGGTVSDHAVIDADLDTLHVFTSVEVARIPPARARAFRMLAAMLAPLAAETAQG